MTLDCQVCGNSGAWRKMFIYGASRSLTVVKYAVYMLYYLDAIDIQFAKPDRILADRDGVRLILCY